MARGNNPNPLRLFAIFLEEHPTGHLADGAFAPYKRFTAGKTLTQGEFTSPEHFNHQRVEPPFGWRNPNPTQSPLENKKATPQGCMPNHDPAERS